MKKLLGILGTVAGAGLLGAGVFALTKKNKDVVVEEEDFKGYGDSEDCDEVDSEEE